MSGGMTLPSDPPRSSSFGRNARIPIARLACILINTVPDPNKALVRGVRDAEAGRCGVKDFDVDGVSEPFLDAGSIVTLAAHQAGIDVTSPRGSEAFLEYAQKCLEHYGGMSVSA